MAISADGRRIFAWDTSPKVLAWSRETGQPVDPSISPLSRIARRPASPTVSAASSPSATKTSMSPIEAILKCCSVISARFQSAGEVAELLAQHLVHLQQPLLAPQPPELSQRSRVEHVPRGPMRRWRAAAVVLVLLAAGLGATEAIGVTKLTATVIRIFTPDGTLVIEVEDPNIQVSIDGADIRIPGAGPQEVRLRPGGCPSLPGEERRPNDPRGGSDRRARRQTAGAGQPLGLADPHAGSGAHAVRPPGPRRQGRTGGSDEHAVCRQNGCQQPVVRRERVAISEAQVDGGGRPAGWDS